METLKYKALLAAVDTGSFRAAGEQLGYTPAAIFNMVNSVENDLGIAILKRGHFGVELSTCGEELISQIRDVVRVDDTLKGKALDITGLVSGKVSIGAYFSISAHFLPEVFSIFHSDFPNVEIDLHEGGYQSLEKMRKESLFDFCITASGENKDMDWIPLFDDEMFAVVPPGHRFESLTSINIEDCLKEDFIMPANGKDHDVEKLFGEYFGRLNICFKTMENYSTLAMVEKGMGISVMNSLITKRLNFRVKYVPFQPREFIHFGISIPSLKMASPAAKKMVAYIIDQADRFVLSHPGEPK